MHVDDTALAFDNDTQISSFQTALGRIVSYGLKAQANTGIEHVEITINEQREIIGAFYPARNWPLGSMPIEVYEPFIGLGTALDAFRTERPLVVGAILRPDGEYTYHV